MCSRLEADKCVCVCVYEARSSVIGRVRLYSSLFVNLFLVCCIRLCLYVREASLLLSMCSFSSNPCAHFLETDNWTRPVQVLRARVLSEELWQTSRLGHYKLSNLSASNSLVQDPHGSHPILHVHTNIYDTGSRKLW